MGQELVKVTLKLLSSGSTTTENYTAFWTILVKYGKKWKITDDYSVGILGNLTQAFASLLYVSYNSTQKLLGTIWGKNILYTYLYLHQILSMNYLGFDPKRLIHKSIYILL